MPQRATKTSFKKGDPKNPRKLGRSGRKKGTPNKITADLRLHILNALQALGGENYLQAVGRRDTRSFTGLVKAVIPAKIVTIDPEEAAAAIREKLTAIEDVTAPKESDDKSRKTR